MAKFYALANIDHDGKRFERGDVITIDGDAAERLLSFDVIQKEPVEKGIAAEVAAPVNPEDAPAELSAGGEKTTTGEPSLDNSDTVASKTDAVDVTPVVEYETMKRDELEAIAVEKGIAAEVAADAPNKPALIEMIKAVPADANVGAEL